MAWPPVRLNPLDSHEGTEKPPGYLPLGEGGGSFVPHESVSALEALLVAHEDILAFR